MRLSSPESGGLVRVKGGSEGVSTVALHRVLAAASCNQMDRHSHRFSISWDAAVSSC